MEESKRERDRPGLLKSAVMTAYRSELGCRTQTEVAKVLGISKGALTQRFSTSSIPSRESLRSFLEHVSSEALRAEIIGAWSRESGTGLDMVPRFESGIQPGLAAKRLADQGEHSLSLAEALERARSGEGGEANFALWVQACEAAYRLDRPGTAMAIASEFLERSKSCNDVACQALAMAMATRSARRAGERYSAVRALADDALALLASLPKAAKTKPGPGRAAAAFIDSEICNALLELSDRQHLSEAQSRDLRRLASARNSEARSPGMAVRAAVLEAWAQVALGDPDGALEIKQEVEVLLGRSRELVPVEARVMEKQGRVAEAIRILEELSVECDALGDLSLLAHAQRQLVRLRLGCNRTGGQLRLGPPGGIMPDKKP